MPAIYLFQRRTLLGGDDLQVPAIFNISFRLFIQGICLVLPLFWQLRLAAKASTTYNNGSGTSSSPSSSLWEFLLLDPTSTSNGNSNNNGNADDNDIDNECYHSHFFPFMVFFYLSSTLLFILISCGIEYKIFYYSCQGTPTQEGNDSMKRSYQVESLMEIKLIVLNVMLIMLVSIGLASTIFGPTYKRCHDALLKDISYGNDDEDDNDNDLYVADDDNTNHDSSVSDVIIRNHHRFGSRAWWLGYGILLLTQIAEIVLTFVLLLNLLCQPKTPMIVEATDAPPQPQQRHRHQHYQQSSTMAEERWATRCHILCSCLSVSTCFIFGGRDLWIGRFGSSSGRATTSSIVETGDPITGSTATGIPYHYNAVARALTDYLETHGILDVVPTDIVMGLLILQRVQRQRILESRLHVLTNSQNNSRRLQQQQQSQSRVLAHTSSSISASSQRSTTSTPPRSQTLDRADIESTSLPVETVSAVSTTTTATVADSSIIGVGISGLPLTVAPDSTSTGLRSRTNSTNDLAAKVNDNNTALLKVDISTANNRSNTNSVNKLSPEALSCRRRKQRVRTSLHRRRGQSLRHQPHQQRQHSLEHLPTDNIVDDDGEKDGVGYLISDEEQQNSNQFKVSSPFDFESTSSSFLQQNVLDVNHPPDVRILQDGARFARYALSIYTWMMYLYVHPISGLPKLLCGPTRRHRQHPTSVVTDACSSCCLFCLKSGRTVQLRRHAQRLRMQRRRQRGSEDDEDGNNGSDSSLLPPISYQQEQQQNQGVPAHSPKSVSSNSPISGDIGGYSDINSTSIPMGTPEISPLSPANITDNIGRDHLLHDPDTVLGDTVCDLHKHSLLLTAQIDESELVYADFNNTLSSVPYCILLDHTTQSVVVSVRGTLSLEDLVTDVDLDPEPLEPLAVEFGLYSEEENQASDNSSLEGIEGKRVNPFLNQYAHGGVVACVRNLYKDLQRHQLLDRLLLGGSNNANNTIEEDSPLPLYPNYTLTLVGHSLGGAACVLLSYLLQPRFPTVRVWTYSPPGCTMTWELATKCQEWTTTFVLDSDLVPRLSLDSLEWLRNDVLQIIGRVKVPKYKVAQTLILAPPSSTFGNNNSPEHRCPTSRFPCCVGDCWGNGDGYGRGICCSCCGGGGDYEEDLQVLNRVMDDLLLPVDEAPPETLYQRQLDDFLQIQHERKRTRGVRRTVALFPPGRMIHLVKTGETSSTNKCVKTTLKILTCNMTNVGSSYTPVWIANDDLDEIVVSPTMGTDHFVDRICTELDGVAKEFTILPPIV